MHEDESITRSKKKKHNKFGLKYGNRKNTIERPNR